MVKISNYFEKREKTYPQDIKGRFRKIKNISGIIFLIIFFFSPFLTWNRGLDLSNQAILIDIVNSRGYFFFIKIWPEETFYLAGILIFAAIALFFVTSLFGRVWCGYSCPQTVWTDLFVKVERFFQGDRNDRILMDRKNSFRKFIKKFATHLVWILISLITGVGFVSYFNDSYGVINNILNFNLSINIASWIFGVGGMTYIMAGFAREQVCNYMCPYARFQSVMFDNDTLIISYDQKRGEKRAKYKIGDSFENRGDCIDCKQCVVVCPQNIDIRNGLQMECIACGLCIDACDITMKKIGLPTGLIKYDTESHLIDSKNNSRKFSLLRPRTLIYSVLLAVVGFLLIFNLTFKSTLDLKVISMRNPLFVTLSNGDIRNGYNIKLFNKSDKNIIYKLKITNIKDLKIKVQRPLNLDLQNINVRSDSVKELKIYISAKRKYLDLENGRNSIKFILEDRNNNILTKNAVFIAK